MKRIALQKETRLNFQSNPCFESLVLFLVVFAADGDVTETSTETDAGFGVAECSV